MTAWCSNCWRRVVRWPAALGKELALHSALVLQDELLATVLVEIDPAVAGLEMVGVEDLVAEEVQGQGLDQDRPEGLHEVQGQRPAAILGGVEQAEGRVQAVGVKEGHGFGVKESGAEGDAGVDGVEGRAGGAALEGEVLGQEARPRPGNSGRWTRLRSRAVRPGFGCG